MKEIFDIINHLTENLALGKLTAAPSRVLGGLMHKMYRVETTHGCYAVKHLNPEIMSRPSAKGNFARAEALETRLTEAGLPVVAALSFHGRKMQEFQGNYFYIFPWQEGHITDFHHISADQCEKAGQILGKMHAIVCSDTIASCDTVALCNTEVTAASGPGSSGKTESEKALSENPETPCVTDFSQYLAAAEKKNTCLRELLQENLPHLQAAKDSLNAARKRLPPLLCITDDDMDPKNVMWDNGAPHVIDLECLDCGNPVKSCLILSLQWAGTVTEDFSAEKLQAFFRGYLDAYDNGFRAYDEVFGLSYEWLDWLEYNLKRALGLTGAGEEERLLGEQEAISTLRRIRYLQETESVIRQTLKTIAL